MYTTHFAAIFLSLFLLHISTLGLSPHIHAQGNKDQANLLIPNLHNICIRVFGKRRDSYHLMKFIVINYAVTKFHQSRAMLRTFQTPYPYTGQKTIIIVRI